MFRQFIKAFEPVKSKLSRTVVGGKTTGPDEGGSAFSKKCVTREQKITQMLRKSLPGITYVSVQDISGGCGAMFEINIEAKEFDGLTRVKQHRLVTDSLKTEIAEMHGIRINTTPPPQEK